jgi:hypothetical protein
LILREAISFPFFDEPPSGGSWNTPDYGSGNYSGSHSRFHRNQVKLRPNGTTSLHFLDGENAAKPDIQTSMKTTPKSQRTRVIIFFDHDRHKAITTAIESSVSINAPFSRLGSRA